MDVVSDGAGTTDANTVSPTWKVPEVIVISNNFGTNHSLTSTSSKNP